jgi:hypothetical protein
MMAVYLYAGSLGNLTVIPLSASAYHRTATLAAIAGFAVIAGLAFLARGLTALPALIRFLRAGGWPKIRRRAAWAVAATVVAAGGLTWFFLMASSMTYDQINRSSAYTASLVTTAVLAETAFVLWRSAAQGHGQAAWPPATDTRSPAGAGRGDQDRGMDHAAGRGHLVPDDPVLLGSVAGHRHSAAVPRGRDRSHQGAAGLAPGTAAAGPRRTGDEQRPDGIAAHPARSAGIL